MRLIGGPADAQEHDVPDNCITVAVPTWAGNAVYVISRDRKTAVYQDLEKYVTS